MLFSAKENSTFQFHGVLFAICLFFSIFSQAQNDSLPYELYKKKIVLYSDFGFNTAPFSVHYNFPEGVDKLKYRNNYKNLLGFGGSYKWFSLRVSLALGQNARPVDRFGRTNYGALGFNFSFKKYFWDVDLRSVVGYAIKNAYKWNDSLSPNHPHDIRSATKSFSFSINTWYFHNHHFKMQAVLGKTGHFLKPVHTWYLKGTFNIYGISNSSNSMVPNELIDKNNSKTGSSAFSAVEIGTIPGYAYATRKNNWQVSGLFGLGAVIQNKIYNVGGISRGFLGLAPRYDIKFVGGYSTPSYFLFLVTDFDNKSIRFNNFVYRQSYYTLKLVGGIRLNKEEKKKKDKKN